jgi:hypothetical protein
LVPSLFFSKSSFARHVAGGNPLHLIDPAEVGAADQEPRVFAEKYGPKYDKAVACLTKDKGRPARLLRAAKQTGDLPQHIGLRREHIPELIRPACDAASNWADPDSREAWTLLHAWRALGQPQAEASVAPLVAFLRTAECDQAVGQDFPVVFGMILEAVRSPFGTASTKRFQPCSRCIFEAATRDSLRPERFRQNAYD